MHSFRRRPVSAYDLSICLPTWHHVCPEFRTLVDDNGMWRMAEKRGNLYEFYSDRGQCRNVSKWYSTEQARVFHRELLLVNRSKKYQKVVHENLIPWRESFVRMQLRSFRNRWIWSNNIWKFVMEEFLYYLSTISLALEIIYETFPFPD